LIGPDLFSWWLTVNSLARSALSAPVTIYGLDLLAASVTLNAIMKSSLRTPGMLINEAAGDELDALQRRQQFGVKVILGTIVFGFVLPVIAVAGYILVSILFFITPTISYAKEKLKKKS
jgi:hypothetical protein